MSLQPCDQLDDFLCHDLNQEAREQFLIHLQDCSACRERVEAEQSLDSLLSEAIQSQPVPSTLLKRLPPMRRRRVGRWVAALAAVMLMAFLVWWRMQSDEPMSPPTVKKKPEPVPTQPVQVKVKASKNLIAVPMQTGDPKVSVIWLYQVRGAETKQD